MPAGRAARPRSRPSSCRPARRSRGPRSGAAVAASRRRGRALRRRSGRSRGRPLRRVPGSEVLRMNNSFVVTTGRLPTGRKCAGPCPTHNSKGWLNRSHAFPDPDRSPPTFRAPDRDEHGGGPRPRPRAETFGSRTTDHLRLRRARARRPSSTSAGTELGSADPQRAAGRLAGWRGGRVASWPGWQARNTLVVEAADGLLPRRRGPAPARRPGRRRAPTSTPCRSWTPAPRWFACFDQPDLKAPVRARRSTAPEDWTVLGNGPSRRRSRRAGGEIAPDAAAVHLLRHRWSPVRTPRCYARARRHDPLGVCTSGRRCGPQLRGRGGRHARGDPGVLRLLPPRSSGSGTRSASTTRPSCPTSTPARWRTPAASRSATSSSSAAGRPRPSGHRAGAIAHEMAHMWFGDLVTMPGGTTCG